MLYIEDQMPQDATDAPGCSSHIIKFEFSKIQEGGIESAPVGGLDLETEPAHDQQLIENRDFDRL